MGRTMPGMRSVRVGDFRPSIHGLHFPNAWPPGPTLRLGPFDPRWFGVGDASQGLCGGMAFVVGDCWAAGVLPPEDRRPPPVDSPRFRRLVHRQVESLDWGRLPLALWRRSVWPDRTARPGCEARRGPESRAGFELRPEREPPPGLEPPPGPEPLLTAALRRLGVRPLADLVLDRDWPAIRRTIDAGRLAMVGLVRRRSANPWALVGNHQVVAYGYRLGRDEIRIAVYDPNHPDRDDVELVVELGTGGRAAALFQTTGEPLFGLVCSRYRPEPPEPWRPARAGPLR